jgi:glycosyltransferase involved in cell wall biosynthesis
MSIYADMVCQALSSYPAEINVTHVDVLALVPRWPQLPRRLQQRFTSLWLLAIAPYQLRRYQADIFHLLDGSYSYILSQLSPEKCLVTVHDLIPLLQSAGFFSIDPPNVLARWLIQQNLTILKRQQHLCSDSDCTAKDVKKITNIDSEVIYLGINHNLLKLRPNPLPSWSERIVNQERIILHIGNNGFYKNRPTVIQVFAQLNQKYDLRLIMAGADADNSLKQLVSDLKIESKVNFVAQPDEVQLANLYSQASILLFPSYYEGFGWPPLEAMAFGCPVVCSNTGSLPEIVGNAALLASPSDVNELSCHCSNLLGSPPLAEEKIQEGLDNIKRFNDATMAEKLLRLYKQIIQT